MIITSIVKTITKNIRDFIATAIPAETHISSRRNWRL